MRATENVGVSSGGGVDPRRPSIVALTIIAALGTIGMHILIPVLPLAARELGTTTAHLQLTITVYMAGLAVGQLCFGVLSDRFGRRPVLLAGLAVFFVGMVAAIPAQTTLQLLAARLVQSFGACAGLVLGRAMVQDIAKGNSAADLAILSVGMTATPMLAPLAGIVVGEFAGWRGVFYVLATGSLILGVWCWYRLPETHLDRAARIGVCELFRRFVQTARSRPFLGFVIGGSCVTVGSFVFLGALPTLAVEVLGESRTVLAAAYLGITACLTSGSLSARLLARRVEPLLGSRIGALIATAGAVTLLLPAATGMLGPTSLLVAMALFAYGAGLTSPNSLAGALLCSPGRVGTASALFGASQMTLGALMTSVPAMLGNQHPVTMGILLLVTSLIGLAALFGLSRTFPGAPLPI